MVQQEERTYIKPYRNLFEQSASQISTLPLAYRPPEAKEDAQNNDNESNDNKFEDYVFKIKKQKDSRTITIKETKREEKKYPCEGEKKDLKSQGNK